MQRKVTPMIRRLLWILTAALAVPVAVLAQPPGTTHAPKIVCDEPTFRFGDVENSRDVEHTFVVRNEGDLTLDIQRVRPSCGCTVVSTSRNSVPPGGQTEITAKLSLRGRQGQQHKTIAVESSDPKTPTLTLALEGNAVVEINVRPSQVFFGRIPAGATVTGMVEIAVATTNPVNLTKVSVDTETLSVTHEVAEAGKLLKVLVSTRPPLPKGTLRGNVHIETDYPKYPAMDVSVSAFVVGTLSYAPEEITLVDQAGQAVSRFVVIRAEQGQPLEIKSVEPPVPSIRTTVSPTEPNSYRIELADIVSSKELDGKTLKIITSDPNTSEITIPFRVVPNTPGAVSQ